MTVRDTVDAARRARTTKLTNNAVINVAGSLAFYVSVVIVTPMAIRELGDRMWGIWQLVGSLTSYALLINLGLNGAVSYHVAAAIAREDTDELSASIHHARLYFLLAGTVIVAAFLTMGQPLVAYLVGEAESRIAYVALILSAAITGFTLPAQVFTSVLSGMQRFDVIAIARLGSGLLLVLVCGFGFYYGEMGLLSFVALMSIVPVVPGCVSWIAARRLLPREALRPRRFDLPFLREMLSYSVNTVLYTAGTVILFQSMKVMAAWKAGGPVAAGHVGLVVNVAQILSVFFVPLVGVLLPRVRDLASRGREDELPSLVLRSLMATSFLVMPVVLFTTVEARLIFEAWVGDSVSAETIDALGRTVRWMMLGQGPFMLFLPCFYALVGVGAHRVFGVGMIVAGVVNAGLGWIALSQLPQIESLGLAFGVTLAALVFLVTVPATLRRFRIDYWAGLRAAMLWPACVAAPGILALCIRPDLENAKIELFVAGALFGAFVSPGLLIARHLFSRRPT